MNPFILGNPTMVIFGQDRLAELDKQVPKNAKVMIVMGGGSVEKNGTLAKVTEALGSRQQVIFRGVEPNPQYTTLMKAVEQVRDEGVTFLLAVGGGSVMDGTKFIALASDYPGDASELLTNSKIGFTSQTTVGLGCVVTLPATGSEMNPGGVITYKDRKRVVFNPNVFPKFSFLDPKLTQSLPKEQVANGVVDAFVHVCEQYLTYPVDARVQDRFSEGILQTLIEIGEKTVNDPEDMDARSNLVFAATMALNGLISSGVPVDWATHMIGHELTASFGIAHGRTLAVILPSMLEYRKDRKHEKLVQYGKRVFGLEGSDEQVISLAIEKTREFFESLGVKTRLCEYGVKKELIPQITLRMEEIGLTKLSEHGDLTLQDCHKILELSL